MNVAFWGKVDETRLYSSGPMHRLETAHPALPGTGENIARGQCSTHHGVKVPVTWVRVLLRFRTARVSVT